MREIAIGPDDAGQRLDRFLRKALPGSALGNLFRLLRKGVVRVNGCRAEGDLRLEPGDRVQIRLADDAIAALGPAPHGAASASRPSGGSGPARTRGARLTVLHRDDHVLAVDKPPFVLVQPGEGAAREDAEPTLDRLVLDLVGRGAAITFHPALAHRLDRGTSGIVLFGLTAAGLRGLTDLFRRREVAKRYVALVEGEPPEDRFTIDLPLARDPSDDRRGAKVKVSRGEGAQEAVTDFVVLGRDPGRGLALVEARPRTGRTHQIRAHLRAARLPIAGDPTYGDPRTREAWTRRGLRRQFLHAAAVRFVHPVGPGREVRIRSPLAADLRRVLARTALAAGLLEEE